MHQKEQHQNMVRGDAGRNPTPNLHYCLKSEVGFLHSTNGWYYPISQFELREDT